MTVERASVDRLARYDRWYDLFLEEVSLVRKPNATTIAVGREVARQLRRRAFPHTWHRVIHYSPLAARARREAILGREEEFRRFSGSLHKEEILESAEEVLRDAGTPRQFREAALGRLARSKLTESRKMLVFAYRQAFGAIRSATGDT